MRQIVWVLASLLASGSAFGQTACNGPYVNNSTCQPISIVTTQTGAYTFAATDCDTTVDTTFSAAANVTVPNTLPIGCRIVLSWLSGSAPTIVNAAGEAIDSYNTATSTSTQSTTTAGSFSQALGGIGDSRVIAQKTAALAFVSAGQ